MLGPRRHDITHASAADSQPMKANDGIGPPLSRRIRNKRERYAAYARRALEVLDAFLAGVSAS